MKRISEQQKEWQQTRRLHTMRRRHRRRKRHSSRASKNNQINQRLRLDRDQNGIILKVPICFSLIENKEETLSFFEKALSATKVCEPRQRIFFDLKEVKKITADAIMYLIALVNNVKRCQLMNISCGGNLPTDDSARALLVNSGFYDHVRGKAPPLLCDTSKRIQITSGNTADGELIGDICNFICTHTSDFNRISTKPLYPIIIELMTNTIQHAYRSTNYLMDDKWFIFVEDVENYVKFVFLDTGAGIPYTIRRTFSEKIKQRLLNSRDDARLIESALMESFRSETHLGHRSKGLPSVYEVSKDERILDLTIISGRGECHVTEKGEIETKSSSVSFVGTLFCWQFKK